MLSETEKSKDVVREKIKEYLKVLIGKKDILPLKQ